MNTLGRIFLISSLLSFQSAFAQVHEYENSQETPNGTLFRREKRLEKPDESAIYREKIFRSDNYRGVDFSVFFGGVGGYLKTINGNVENESSKIGYETGGKFLGSVFSERWAFDMGVGWFYSKISGSEKVIRESTGEITSDLQAVRIVTQAGFFEFAPRFHLTHNLQLAVVSDLLFGTDLSFGAVPSSQTFVGMIGPQVTFGVPQKSLDWRFGIAALTSVNLQKRQILNFQCSVELGLPILKPDIIVREKQLQSLKHRVSQQIVEKPIIKVIIKEVLKFVYENDELRFEPSRPNFPASQQGFLLDLANTLTRVQETWKEVTVEASADSGGDEAVNERLSAGRAAALKNSLVAGGVPLDRVFSRAMSPSGLASNSGKRKGTRIELVFSGVTNSQRLGDALTQLKKLNTKPETCSDTGCK